MFENLQDTCLLHNTIMSVMGRMNPSQESEPVWPPALKDSNEAVEIEPFPDTTSESSKESTKDLSEMDGANMVASFITALVKKRVKDPLTVAKYFEHFHVNRRCHASMFYVVLKSHGITCAQATSYFESIHSCIPSITWKFYIMMCFLSEWSEYFIESAVQLESDILIIIIKNILNIDWAEEELKYYSWHMVLQVMIWKFFMLEDPTLCSFPEAIPFSYPFAVANSLPETENQELTENCSQDPLLNTYEVILNHLLSCIDFCGGNFYYNKVILHAYKTIFKLVRKLKTFEKNVVRKLFQLNTIFKQWDFEKKSQGAVNSYSKQDNYFLTHYYSNASWKIPEDYLLFILCSYWNDALKIMSVVDKTQFVSLAEHFPSNEVKNRLISLCSFYANHLEVDDVSFLKCLLIYKSPCATNAATVILRHPKIREEEDILQILEQNASVLKPTKIYQELIDVIVQTESEERRIRFIKLLHLLLSRATCTHSGSIYNDALKHMNLKRSINTGFELDNFDEELAAFSRKTMSLKEAEKCLLPLFIQSPRVVLKALIEQALMWGSGGMNVLQILRLVPVACLYHDSLVEELQFYFNREKLEKYEEKNLSKLIESLIDIHADTPLLNLDNFLQTCFIENKENKLKQLNRLQVNYECLIVALKVLTNKNALIISMEVYQSLIDKMCSFISTSIQLANGKAKTVAIAILSLLEKCQKHGSLQDAHKLGLDFDSNPFSAIIHVYTSRLFEIKSHEDIPGASDELCDSLLTWCCHFKDITPFQNIVIKNTIPYDSLVEVIIKVLPHFTKEEWLGLTHLIEEYYKFADPSVVPCGMQWLLPQTDRRLYTVIRCLMDCYIYIVAEAQHYTTACFTNTVMNLLKNKASPELYLNIFLDTCHLISVTNTLTLHLSFLSNIKKEIQDKLKDKESKLLYNRVMYYGMKNLPNYEEKDSIMQQFQ